MKLTKQKLKQIIKEELNEISKKQRDHEARLAQQMAQKQAKRKEAERIRQQLGPDWKVAVRMVDDRYQIIITEPTLQDLRNRAARGQENARAAERAKMEEIAQFLEKEYEGATIKVIQPHEAAKEVNWLTSCGMYEPPRLVYALYLPTHSRDAMDYPEESIEYYCGQHDLEMTLAEWDSTVVRGDGWYTTDDYEQKWGE